MNILYSISGGFAVFFIVLLISKKNKQIADYILTAWFALILMAITFIYAQMNDFIKWQGLNELADCLVLLHGPLIWMYTVALTKENFKIHQKHIIHFIPFLIGVIYLFIPLFSGRIISLAERNGFLIIKMLHLLVYALIVYRMLENHEKRIGNLFSFKEDVELGWLKLLVLGVISIWTISAISQFLFALEIVDIPSATRPQS